MVGAGDAAGSEIGPIQNRAQFDRVVALIDEAGRDGRILAGGVPDAGEGFFVAPTIVADVSHDAPIVAAEQFGPVLPVIAYDDVADAVRWADDSPFGLAASIWTGDHRRGLEMARQITCGTVWINRHLDLPFDVSFGGAKQSGIGRERGRQGLEEYTQLKIINMAKT